MTPPAPHTYTHPAGFEPASPATPGSHPPPRCRARRPAPAAARPPPPRHASCAVRAAGRPPPSAPSMPFCARYDTTTPCDAIGVAQQRLCTDGKVQWSSPVPGAARATHARVPDEYHQHHQYRQYHQYHPAPCTLLVADLCGKIAPSQQSHHINTSPLQASGCVSHQPAVKGASPRDVPHPRVAHAAPGLTPPAVQQQPATLHCG